MEYNQIQYQSFIAEQIVEQSIMERYIMECVLMGNAQNSVKNITTLNESVSDKIKEAFKKILEAIGKMWGKFLEAMTNLINGNRAYLEKYKDTILKKKLSSDATYKMYNYSEGIKRMLQTPVPVFNYAAMEGELDTPEHFIESDQYLKKIAIKNSDAAFADQAKTYFRGSTDPIDIPSARINMTDIFNYCYDYEKKMKPLLEKDLNSIKTAANSAAEIIDKAERENNSANNNSGNNNGGNNNSGNNNGGNNNGGNNGNNNNNSGNNNGGNNNNSGNNAGSNNNGGSGNNNNGNNNNAGNNGNNQQVHNNAASLIDGNKYYSTVYEEYITELEISHGGANNGGNDNSPAKNMQNTQGDKPKPEDQNTAIRNDKSSYDDKIKKVQNYLNICGGLLAAKQTIAEEIFKEYMQIIKDHVRQNVGTSKKDTSNDKVADAGTNYKNVVDKALSGGQKPADNNNSGDVTKDDPKDPNYEFHLDSKSGEWTRRKKK